MVAPEETKVELPGVWYVSTNVTDCPSCALSTVSVPVIVPDGPQAAVIDVMAVAS